MYLDSSYCRDKVNRAAGQRAVGSVFCSPSIKSTVTSKLRCYYRDSYVIDFYRDGTPCVLLPGLAKNSPTLTQTATSYTTEPLAFIYRPLRDRNLLRDSLFLTIYLDTKFIIFTRIKRTLTHKNGNTGWRNFCFSFRELYYNAQLFAHLHIS